MVQVLFSRIVILIAVALVASTMVADAIQGRFAWPVAVAQTLAALVTMAVLTPVAWYLLVPLDRVLAGIMGLGTDSVRIVPTRLWMKEERAIHEALDLIHGRLSAADPAPTGVSLTLVLDGLSEGVLILDRAMRCVHANTALRMLAGVGDNGRDVATAELDRLFHARTFVPEQLALVEDEMRAKPDAPRTDIIQLERPRQFLRRYSAPLYDEQGVLDGFLVSYQDITREVEQDRVRQDFIANASHELRTPVTSVKVLLENLQDGAKEDPGLRDEFLGDAAREIDRMHDLVNDLLDIAKLEASRDNLAYSQVDLLSLIEDAAASVRPQARARQVEVSVTVVPDGLSVWADAPRLRQVLVNLVANGVKFTANGGGVAVVASEEAGRVEITVSDTGIGIPTKDLPHIFDRFFRVTRGRSRLQGGSGLGLTIVKQVIDAHQGAITVESTEGIGTTFRLNLPNVAPGKVPELD